MTQRIPAETLHKLQPKLMQALLGLGQAVAVSGLETSLLELVKLRASQINGCAFCLDMHAVDARKHGETQQRLDLLPAWEEARCFSERERAALAWTEALTLIAEDRVPDAVYERVASVFSEAELVNLTVAVVTINSWNRVNVAFRVDPPERN